jgi:hypothetical protein
MEELKLLIGMVADLPALAIWVLVAFYAYKVMIVGSIYGVIRFAIEKTHSWLTTPKHQMTEVDIRGTLEGMCLTTQGAHRALFAQLERVRGQRTGSGPYIHGRDVEWLRDAIDAQEAKDLEAKWEKTA